MSLGLLLQLNQYQNRLVNDASHFGTLLCQRDQHVSARRFGSTRLYPMGEHRQEFQRELEAIEAKVIELFAMVAEDLPTATQALLTGNNEAAQVLAERDQIIDALYTETDELVNREILLQAPVASDLRFLLSVLRIVPELERSPDLVMQIASRANHLLGEDLSSRSRGLVERMGNHISGMWRQAADSWYQRDRSAAFALGEREDETHELHVSLVAEL